MKIQRLSSASTLACRGSVRVKSGTAVEPRVPEKRVPNREMNDTSALKPHPTARTVPTSLISGIKHQDIACDGIAGFKRTTIVKFDGDTEG